MKASYLIDKLSDLMKKHGDCDVYCEYDGGIRIECENIIYRKEIEENAYSGYWGMLKNVFIVNFGEVE